ncbi:RidA family protein [Gelidibacter japonicus]|uniref:RidA family protein n=1 Tax=Gelidibacter japonicus TaxID=1962232 RepID=UPI002020808D|nr:RidA family protein [Gelidibacter japonicus]MCL8009113.1 RidA family protein [Gelidibacter japonicus]
MTLTKTILSITEPGTNWKWTIGIDWFLSILIIHGPVKLNNIKAITESIDHDLDDAGNINIQLKNIADIVAINNIYRTFFKSDLPARTIIDGSKVPINVLIQIDTLVSNSESTSV